MSKRKFDPIEQGFDPDFAENGVAADFSPGSSWLKISGIDSGGTILLVGSVTTDAGTKIQIVQLLADGTKDRKFGIGGIVLTNFKDGIEAQAIGAHRLEDGKILLTGLHWDGSACLAFARFTATGLRDETFGDNGVVIHPPAAELESEPSASTKPFPPTRLSAVGPDGNIIITSTFKISRFKSNGEIDLTFNQIGYVVTPDLYMYGVGISDTGAITVTGRNGNGAQGIIARFNANGTTDGSYGNGGFVKFKGHEALTVTYDLLLRKDGSSFVVGATSADPSDESKRRSIIAAFNSSGHPNLVFNDGKPVISELKPGQPCHWNGIAGDPEQGLFVVGFTGITDPATPTDNKNILVARYKATGEIDTTFGQNGFRVTDIGTGDEEAMAVRVLPNRKPIVSCDFTDQSNPAAVICYQGN